MALLQWTVAVGTVIQDAHLTTDPLIVEVVPEGIRIAATTAQEVSPVAIVNH